MQAAVFTLIQPDREPDRYGASRRFEDAFQCVSANVPGQTTGKPLIESDRVEGTTLYDPRGNNIGSIKRLMIGSSRRSHAPNRRSCGKASGLPALCRACVIWP